MSTLAVVPIFVTGGAAVLPAVLAGAASVLALLFKPRELARAVRTHPGRAAGVIGACLALGAAGWWLLAGTPAHRSQASAAALPGGARQDRAQIASDLIDRQRAAEAPATPGLTPLWAYHEEGAAFLSSPLVAGDRVYVASMVQDVTGALGAVACLDAKTGRPIWQKNTLGDDALKPFFSSPALSADGKALLIGQGLHQDRDCSLLCFDAETGELRWQAKTPLHIESSPAVHGDMVVVGAGAIEGGSEHKAIGDPGFVFAVRISDGKELWHYAVNDPECSPAIGDDGTVYIGSGFNGNAVVALRSEPDDELKAKNLSRLMWKIDAPYPITGTVTLAGDLVLVGGGNGDYVYANPNPAGLVLALDRATGAVRWKADMPDAVLGAVAFRDGKVICPVRNGEVVALDVKDGKPFWRQRVSGDAAVLAGPAVSGKLVYAVSRDGVLAVLNLADGAVVEKKQVNEEGKPGKEGLCLSSPTVAAGRLYVGTETGGVRCFAGAKAGE